MLLCLRFADWKFDACKYLMYLKDYLTEAFHNIRDTDGTLSTFYLLI